MNRPYVIPQNKQLLSTKKINEWYQQNQFLVDRIMNEIELFFIENQFVRHPNILDKIRNTFPSKTAFFSLKQIEDIALAV